jgi:glyoxylate/hydroxypyruvate reductase A
MRIHGLSKTASASHLVDRHFTPDGWIEFVRDLDVLVLALPLTRETEGVVDGRVIASMRSGAVLVNVGRGLLVDEVALVDALCHGTIGGAVLDVFQTEPLPPDSPLWNLHGVTVTPHISGPSTIEGVGAFFLDNVHRFVRGDPLAGAVDRWRGY